MMNPVKELQGDHHLSNKISMRFLHVYNGVVVITTLVVMSALSAGRAAVRGKVASRKDPNPGMITPFCSATHL